MNLNEPNSLFIGKEEECQRSKSAFLLDANDQIVRLTKLRVHNANLSAGDRLITVIAEYIYSSIGCSISVRYNSVFLFSCMGSTFQLKIRK